MMTPELARTIFDYNPETGEIKHKFRDRSFFAKERDFKGWHTRFFGKTATSIKKDGRSEYCSLTVTYMSRLYAAHRVAWMIMTGEEAPLHIDHKNGDATDNRWINLRDGDGVNHYNRKMNGNNTSGHSGVFWKKDSEKWHTRISYKGEIHYLGDFDNKSDAENRVEEFWEERRDVITERHGRPA